jgi:uncharacterized membrane protein YoaK (UPF0700 family)
LGRTLAANAGYVDAAGYVGLVRLFTAHQSGNTVGLGAALGTGSWPDVWRRGVALLAFTFGVAVGTALVEINNRNRPNRSAAVLAAAELVLLGVALAVGEAESMGGVLRPGQQGPYIVAAMALAGAMGVQTVSLRRIGNRNIRTTFITGVMVNVAENFVAAWYQPTDGRRRKMLDFSGMLTSIWVMYLAGAVAGAALEIRWSFAALGVAMAVTAFIAVYDIRSPYRPDLPAGTQLSE